MSRARSLTLYTTPRHLPCGPGSSCCGPVGQPPEAIRALKEALERATGLGVALVDVRGKMSLPEPEVTTLINRLGGDALPVVTLDGEIVCSGEESAERVVEAVKRRL